MAAVHYGGVFDELHRLVGGAWGLVDAATGNEILPAQFNAVFILRENLVITLSDAEIGEWGNFIGGNWVFFDSSGRALTREFDMFTNAGDDGMGGIAHRKTRTERFIPVMIDGTRDEHGFMSGTWGFICDETAEEIIPPQFSEVFPFTRNLAQVRVGGTLNRYHVAVGGYWGVIDGAGNIVVDTRFDMVRILSDELVAVMTDGITDEMGTFIRGNWGIFDINNREVAPIKFRNIGFYYNGVIAINDGSWGFARVS